MFCKTILTDDLKDLESLGINKSEIVKIDTLDKKLYQVYYK